MRKKIILLSFLGILFSCNQKKGNMVVSGKIKGLKKGILYLQKKIDTTTVSVDSITIFGSEEFKLIDNITSPEMYFLTYKGNNQEKKLLFFGEAGEIKINDNIEQFGWKPNITGSKNHELYEKFKKIDNIYKIKRLNFIKEDLEARAKKDSIKIESLKNEYLKMKRKRFASTIQFALNHKDYEIAPYLAISELFDANFIYIDSINNNLSDSVKKSIYGKELAKYVSNIKANQTN